MSCHLLGYLFPGMGNCFSSVTKTISHSFRLPEKDPDAQPKPQQVQGHQQQQPAQGNANGETLNDSVGKPPNPVKKLRKTQSVLTANILGRVTPDVRSLYNIGRELGRGQFGVTYLCTDKVTGEEYACKSIAKRKLVQEEDVEDVRREVAIMHHLAGSPNIVTMKGAYEDRQFVHIVMELCAGGELFDRIVSKGHYSEKAAASLIRTIVQVVETCHSHGVIHRDLKPENFLLLNESEDSPLKATDFGLSVFFKPGEQFSDIVGSAYYVAPEVLLRRYGKEIDIWSCGVMLYILLSGVPPFWAETERGIFEAVSKGYVDFVSDPWPSISKEAKELVKKMLTLDISQRLTASQVLNHPWVRIDGSAPDKPLDTAVLTRLKQFSAMNKLKKIALRVIARNMSPEEIQGLKVMFRSMDDDGSGTITFEELKAGLAKSGSNMPEDQIRELMDAADLDHNGTIDLDEFITATINLHKAQKEENLIDAFKHFDADDSGFITKEELKTALSNEALQPGEIESIIREVDSDHDGRIDYEEFAAMFRKPQKLSPDRAMLRKKSSKNPYDFFVAPPKN